MSSRSYLHLWDDRLLYVTPAIQSGLTARSPATLLVSANGKPFTLVASDGAVMRVRAALVGPYVPRQLDVETSGLLSLNVDPASADFHDLVLATGSRPIQEIDVRRFGHWRAQFEGALHGQLSHAEVCALATGMVQALCGPGTLRRLDPRVDSVLGLLRQRPSDVSLTALAGMAALSPGRMTHLFREQTGLSIRRYLVWAKIRRSFYQISLGEKLTDIAYTAGFADSAHMCRAFQSGFGLKPSFLADRDSVHVTIDPACADAWGTDTAS